MENSYYVNFSENLSYFGRVTLNMDTFPIEYLCVWLLSEQNLPANLKVKLTANVLHVFLTTDLKKKTSMPAWETTKADVN